MLTQLLTLLGFFKARLKEPTTVIGAVILAHAFGVNPGDLTTMVDSFSDLTKAAVGLAGAAAMLMPEGVK
jgi:hypothetical protein